MNSQKAIQELHKAFNLLNEHYYGGKLPEPVIAILSTVKPNRIIYGWFTPNKIWQDESGEIQKHEIAISAEWLKRGVIEVAHTLHHEMVHLYCHINNIKDTKKRGRYHTEKFKDESERLELAFDQGQADPKMGWYLTKVTDEFTKVVEGFDLDPDAFKIARVIIQKKKKVRTKHKYMCPGCEIKVTSSKELNLKCNDCDEDMEQIG